MVAVTNSSWFGVDARSVVNAATIAACISRISAADVEVAGGAGLVAAADVEVAGAGLVAAADVACSATSAVRCPTSAPTISPTRRRFRYR